MQETVKGRRTSPPLLAVLEGGSISGQAQRPDHVVVRPNARRHAMSPVRHLARQPSPDCPKFLLIAC